MGYPIAAASIAPLCSMALSRRAAEQVFVTRRAKRSSSSNVLWERSAAATPHRCVWPSHRRASRTGKSLPLAAVERSRSSPRPTGNASAVSITSTASYQPHLTSARRPPPYRPLLSIPLPPFPRLRHHSHPAVSRPPHRRLQGKRTYIRSPLRRCHRQRPHPLLPSLPPPVRVRRHSQRRARRRKVSRRGTQKQRRNT